MSDEEGSSQLRQKLMTADEVYVYKIPPLKTSGGHRAEDWNLSKPLQTCRLVVERRGSALHLDFLSDNDTIFCSASIDLSKHSDKKLSNWLEQVVDSSRYFVVKIEKDGRQAVIGFGFRDREQATDLRESMQHYEKSMRREKQGMHHYKSIPVMREGEKIHVNKGGKSTTVVTTSSSSKKKKNGGVPLLAKKPPSSPKEEDNNNKNKSDDKAKPAMSQKMIEKMSISMGDINLDSDDLDETEGSDGAVYEGDEEQW